MKPLKYIAKGATISACEQYRYLLWRVWDKTKPQLAFCMLNPSKADGEIDDPTIRKCVGFAYRHGYGGIRVVNIFALRSTDPRMLVAFNGDRIGPDNAAHLRHELTGRFVVFAWGVWGSHGLLADDVDRFVARVHRNGIEPLRILCLGRTKEGQPRHPLMLPYSTPMEVFARCNPTSASA